MHHEISRLYHQTGDDRVRARISVALTFIDLTPGIMEWGRLQFSFAEETRNEYRSVNELGSTRLSDIEVSGDGTTRARIAVIPTQISPNVSFPGGLGSPELIREGSLTWLTTYVYDILAANDKITELGTRTLSDHFSNVGTAFNPNIPKP
jgi:hypothetical protein